MRRATAARSAPKKVARGLDWQVLTGEPGYVREYVGVYDAQQQVTIDGEHQVLPVRSIVTSGPIQFAIAVEEGPIAQENRSIFEGVYYHHSDFTFSRALYVVLEWAHYDTGDKDNPAGFPLTSNHIVWGPGDRSWGAVETGNRTIQGKTLTRFRPCNAGQNVGYLHDPARADLAWMRFSMWSSEPADTLFLPKQP